MLHFCQPTELRSEELGKVRPNEGMMYLKEVFFFPISYARRGLHLEDSRCWVQHPIKKKGKIFAAPPTIATE